jgi:PHD/YefM family antitoxin component YafN of YafNO toxin-antitoxin module
MTKARVNLGQIVRRVHVHNECYILEKDGIPVAGLISLNELEDYLDHHDPELEEQIRASAADYAAGRVRPADEFLAELKRASAAPASTK